MEYINYVVNAVADLPAWVVFLPPAILLLAGIPLALFKKFRAYFIVAGVLGAAGFVLCCGELTAALVYAALHTALACLLLLFSFVPLKKGESREERIYRKFHEDLSEPVALETKGGLPPKVCCFEGEPASASAEDAGMRLAHVTTLLEKLKKEKLTPADRLEVETLTRAVEGSKGRALTQVELDALNDTLASVLRLTAKYKL